MSMLEPLMRPIAVSRALVEGMRGSFVDEIRMVVNGSQDELDLSTPLGDPGLFGPGSMTWRVHGDQSMFIAGIRALLIQTMHPLVMAGVAEHSDYKADPLGRLNRTARFVGVTTFGSTTQAETAIGHVRRIHDFVTGVAPDGRTYEANDPDNLRWVHVTEMDSFLRAYQRYGSDPLLPHEVDRYFDEAAVVAGMLGATRVPRSAREVREYYRDIKPELHVGAQARATVRWLLNPPQPLAMKPPYAVLLSAAIGLIAPSVRRRLWLPHVPAVDPLIVRPAARTLLGAMGWALGPERSAVDAATDRSLGRHL